MKTVAENTAQALDQAATTWSWVNPDNQRYYQATLGQDLLGDWIVALRWGTIGTRRGGHKQHYCINKDQALTFLQRLHQRRLQHQYRLVKGQLEA